MAITIRFLGPPHREYQLGFKSKSVIFRGQEIYPADRDLAEYCSTKRYSNGKPLFEVIGLNGEDPDSDVLHILGVQAEFQAWPSSQQ